MILVYMIFSSIFFRASGEFRDRGHYTCSAYGYTVVEAKFAKEKHLLCLKLIDIGSSALTRKTAAILLDPDVEETESYKAYSLSGITMAYGFPLEDPQSGSAEGYIGEDHHFYGVLHLGNRTLHADPHGKDIPGKFFGAFENDSVVAPPRPRRDHDQVNKLSESPMGTDYIYNVQERKRTPGVARARICDLLLLADKRFYEKDANSNLDHAVRRMIHAIAQADIIFRNSDFDEDGIPDNIGFSIKYILVLTSNETNTRVFGNMLNENAVDGKQYLMGFARLRRLSEVCLGVAFSGHAFHNRTLGLSFTSLGGGIGGAAGGLCDRRAYGRSYNTLAIAHATTDDKERVPERIAALTLSHEMGHSFGAHHDDNFPNSECKGYLMGAQSSTAENSANYQFSLCSKRLIALTLSSMSYCLTEEDQPYCGNGVVEDGEVCDCGLPSSCSHRDPCCTPRAGGALVYDEGTLHKEGCLVAPKAMCHPSQGICCTSMCKYADLSKHGIDCTTLDLECPCPDRNSTCSCALGGLCMPDGTCHARECASLGYEECECLGKGPGGEVGRQRRCGICCMVQTAEGGTCMGAELAARFVLENEPKLPENWPDKDYIGPNVSIELCEDHCWKVYLRAWPVGDPCVAQGIVGVCSATGLCVPRTQLPRNNVFPKIMIVHKSIILQSGRNSR